MIERLHSNEPASNENPMTKWIALFLIAPSIFAETVVRASGLIRAVRAMSVQVPRIEGLGSNITLAKLIPNGATVHKGDLLAEFDRTNELKLLRDAQAKFDDLRHKVDQTAAEHRNNAEKRSSDLQQA